MSVDFSAIFLMGAAIVAFVVAALFLVRGKWLLHWLQGSVGIALLVISAFLIVIGASLLGFRSLAKDEQIASLYFEQLDEQHFRMILKHESGGISEYDLYGDMWQIDARIIKWRGWVSALGMKPGYQLGRIQGRYLSIDKERDAPRSVYSLSPDGVIPGFDLWHLVNQGGIWIPWLDARYGTATFLPMVDGAQFSLSMSHSGLLARAENASAQEAISNWVYD